MGFLDSLLTSKEAGNDEAVNDAGNIKFVLRFSPLRLAALKDNKVNLVVTLTNDSNQPQLISLDALLPRNQLVGFDTTCISKHTEKKLGELKSGESTEVVLPIFANLILKFLSLRFCLFFPFEVQLK